MVEVLRAAAPDLTLEPAGDGPVAIDGACSGIATVDVRADGVAFQGPMTVAGGLFYELNYLGQRSGVVDGLTIMDTCHGSFGILLQDTGGVRVAHSTIEGFAGGGIEVVGPGPAGARPLGLSSNEISGVGRGILVQNANGVDVETNRVHDNTFSGITVEGSQRVLIRGNAALRDGDEGISLDAASTDDRVVGNVALGNTVDLSNAGQGNCFLRNRFQTSQGDIGC
ncbi:MAG TPA: right-handed parallel beta-helix repeat-containing protein [Actinomycetota bacterium]|jgi:parallel beta-helix repeat protein